MGQFGAESEARTQPVASRRNVLSATRILLRVDNLEPIALAYGRAAARWAQNEVKHIVRSISGGDALILSHVSGWTWVSVDLLGGPESIASDRTQPPLDAVELLQAALDAHVVEWNGNRFHLAVSVISGSGNGAVPGSIRDEIRSDAFVLGQATSPTTQRQSGNIASRYRSDMEQVCCLFSAMSGGRVDFAWQPVVEPSGTGPVLYRECLLRIVDADGNACPPDRLIPALERLGFVRALDAHVVSRVLDELEADSIVTLGVNISAQSAVLDNRWSILINRLEERPDLARRLVIEITETTPFPAIFLATEFVDRMRNLGCRIAIDDFGVGYTSIRQLLALRPDIIKIDQFFLARAVASERDQKAFEHIVGLANVLAPVVVAEGVETLIHSRLAQAAGIVWQQGYFLGTPTSIRSWHAPRTPARHAIEQYRACLERSGREAQRPASFA